MKNVFITTTYGQFYVTCKRGVRRNDVLKSVVDYVQEKEMCLVTIANLLPDYYTKSEMERRLEKIPYSSLQDEINASYTITL